VPSWQKTAERKQPKPNPSPGVNPHPWPHYMERGSDPAIIMKSNISDKFMPFSPLHLERGRG